MGQKEKKEVPSVWDAGKVATKGRGGDKGGILDNQEFPAMGSAAPVTKAPPKAPRRKKELNESSSESEESDDENIDEQQQHHQRGNAKSQAKAKAKAPAAKKKQKSKEQQEQQDDAYLEKQSKKQRGGRGTGINRFMNYLHRCYKESFVGSGNTDILRMSPLGLPGKWTSLMNIVWNPPTNDDNVVQSLQRRVPKNLMLLWPRYLEIIMFFYFAAALSAFGLFSIITIAQIGMVRIKAVPTSIISLNHYLIWLLFFRQLYNMDILFKVFTGMAFMAHASLFS